MQVLPILVPLMPGETPASFASRLAWANGLSFASEFCTDQGFTLQAIADGDERALSILARLGGVELAQLMRGVVCKVSTGQYRLAGQLIEKRWITRRRLRFCPECVADDISADTGGGAAQKCAWHVPSIGTCLHHQVRLYDDDSYSHSRGPHDFAGRIRDLNLGTDQLRELVAAQVSTGLEDYLTRRLAGEQQGTWLDNIGFGAVALGAEIFGVVDLFGIDAKLKHLSDNEKRRAGARGFEFLSEGEKGLFRLLRRLHREAGSPISLSRRPVRPRALQHLLTTVREATSLSSALYRFSTFWNLLLDDYQFVLDDAEGALVLTLKPQGEVPLQRFGHMLILKLAHGLMSWLAGHEVPVKAVDFAFDRPDFDQDYAIIFPAPLRFGQPATAIAFDPNVMGPVQTRSTADLDRFLQNAPRDWIFTSSREHTQSLRVRTYLGQTGWDSAILTQTASAMHMTPRTLVRRHGSAWRPRLTSISPWSKPVTHPATRIWR